jgi:LAS superfamily LD-carboxypeptidase LdcB
MSTNGRLSDSELAPIAQGRLAKAAAAAWNAMNVESRKNGLEIVPTGSKSSYRTFAQQQELYNLYVSGKGNLAAKPGTSNHGWGLAVDVATQQMRQMIDRIGVKYGFSKRCSDAQNEWWHIKYDPGCNKASWKGSDPGPSGTATVTPQQPAQPPSYSSRASGMRYFESNMAPKGFKS